MFGLITSADLDATKSNSVRRSVFYENLTGGFPLMGLLSLCDVEEELDKQECGWNEEREIELRSQTAAANAGGPFTDALQPAGAVGTDLTSGGWSSAVSTTIRIKVDDASVFRERDVVWLKDIPGTASSKKQINGIVTAVWTTPNTVDVLLQVAVVNALNDSTSLDFWLSVVGSAAVEGGFSKKGGMTFPITPTNNTQIFRTPVGPFSRNALKMGQKFDKTGAYKTAARQAHIRHMKVMEWPLMFGIKGEQLIIDEDDGETKRVKYFGGIKWFLEQWELGTVGNGAVATYRPGGADLTSTAWDASDEKRVIKLNGGTITYEQWQDLITRAFTYTGDQTFEKLCVCGNGFLGVVNKMLEKQGVKVVSINEKSTTYGMQMYVIDTIAGTLYFKTHPLLTRHPEHKYSAFFLDMGDIVYHPYQDSDTALLPNRQANDFDGRKDEWLTEFGPEIRFPERHMYIDNLRGITV